jgi:hypothetical protein
VGIWPWGWHFSRVITCMLVLAAITEMITRRRPWMLGVLFALVLATRVTAALGVLWCIAEILGARDPWRKKMGSLIAISLPVLVVAALLMVHNHARFGDAFDQGYPEQLIPPGAVASRALGILNLRHIPGNLYAVAGGAESCATRGLVPELGFSVRRRQSAGHESLGHLPMLSVSARLRHRDGTSRLLLLTSLVIAVPILLYYWVGFRQFGWRYSLDFLPFCITCCCATMVNREAF